MASVNFSDHGVWRDGLGPDTTGGVDRGSREPGGNCGSAEVFRSGANFGGEDWRAGECVLAWEEGFNGLAVAFFSSGSAAEWERDYAGE